MSTFDEREKGFERKFALDSEMEFKAMARRNKLLGLWAAQKMGLKGDAAESYAKEVVKADFQEAGDDDVLRKVKGDMEAKGLSFSEHQIRREMDELLAEARAQIKSGG
ncbi:MAG TPA: DUF1476 domain-containing protein [Alphaproteobacteria bacterium]|jgi:hypothetical protein|nr:DUF1476 domain-containing protein [Alphaproteobacteria bacterium]